LLQKESKEAGEAETYHIQPHKTNIELAVFEGIPSSNGQGTRHLQAQKQSMMTKNIRRHCQMGKSIGHTTGKEAMCG
jgi:hypothetical protein